MKRSRNRCEQEYLSWSDKKEIHNKTRLLTEAWSQQENAGPQTRKGPAQRQE